MQSSDDTIDLGRNEESSGVAAELIHVNIATQALRLLKGDAIVAEFPISSAAAGLGFEEGSFKTPTGLFRIAEKIGADAPVGAVFKTRELTGEIASELNPDDQVSTRILWLDGLEPRNANTLQRFIYIHGTNKESEIGTPTSAGCIRMRNEDVARLFDLVSEGTLVHIEGDVEAPELPA
ncbi:MAG: L,D-transpeptidase [Verrucomicrobiia bacterium]